MAKNASKCTDSVFIPGQCVPTAGPDAGFGAPSAYTGNLCGMCSPGYGSSKPFTCGKCMHKGAMIAIYVVGAAVMLFAMKVMCHWTLKEGKKHGSTLAAPEGLKPCEELPDAVAAAAASASNEPSAAIGTAATASSEPSSATGTAATASSEASSTVATAAATASREPSSAAAVAPAAAGSAASGMRPKHLVRHLVLHCQWMLLLGSIQLAGEWPGSVAWALKVLAWVLSPTTPAALAPECLNTSGSTPAIVAKIVFFLVGPLFRLIVMVLIEAVSVRLGFSEKC